MAFSDSVNFSEGLSAGLTTEVVAPEFPCPLDVDGSPCGKATASQPVCEPGTRVILQERRICTGCKKFHFPGS